MKPQILHISPKTRDECRYGDILNCVAIHNNHSHHSLEKAQLPAAVWKRADTHPSSSWEDRGLDPKKWQKSSPNLGLIYF